MIKSKSRILLSGLTTLGVLGVGVAGATTLNVGAEQTASQFSFLDVKAEDNLDSNVEVKVKQTVVESDVKNIDSIVPQTLNKPENVINDESSLFIETTVEEQIEPQVEPVVETTIEEQIEPQIEPVVETTIEEQIEPQVEPVIETTVEEQIEPQIEPVIETTVEEQIEPQIEPVIETTVEEQVESQVEPVVETTVEEQIEPQVEPVIETTVEETTTYQEPVLNYNTNNTYPTGQCTWGAKVLAPWVGNYWGNASQWLLSGDAAGHMTGSTPQVGAVAVWTGGYGHVAVVTAVDGDNIQVMEANYGGNAEQADPRGVGNYRGWFSASQSGISGYVYP